MRRRAQWQVLHLAQTRHPHVAMIAAEVVAEPRPAVVVMIRVVERRESEDR
jgi:hypothetical protein